MTLSRQFSLLGLALLALVSCWWISVSNSKAALLLILIAGILPPLLLGYATYRRTRNWSGITALCMIPYAAIGMMDIVASSGRMAASLALGCIAISVFFLVLDAGRREG